MTNWTWRRELVLDGEKGKRGLFSLLARCYFIFSRVLCEEQRAFGVRAYVCPISGRQRYLAAIALRGRLEEGPQSGCVSSARVQIKI